MSTIEIPRDEWASFFNRFSQRHQGWPVTVEVLDPEIGDQIESLERVVIARFCSTTESVSSKN